MFRIALIHAFTLVGATAAMAFHIFMTASGDSWLSPERIGDSLGYGLIFGHAVALMAVSIYMAGTRIQPVLLRLTITGGVGALFGAAAWATHTILYLRNPSPDLVVLILGGIGLSAGMILGNVFRVPRLITSIVTFAGVFAPVMLSYLNFDAYRLAPQPPMALLYFRPEYPALAWLVSAIFAGLIAFSSTLALGPRRQRS